MADSPIVMDIDSSKMDKYWVDSPNQCTPYERNLNFVALGNDDDDYSFSKKKSARDPMSHRIIEKRRRDRMNNCLADLSKLLPEAYLKRGRGRIEKTEIIEMAIKHLKHLQAHACKDMDHCEIVKSMESSTNAKMEQYRSGFVECMSESVQFLVEVEGYYPEDPICIKMSNHLQNHCDKLMRSGEINFSATSSDMTSPSNGSSLINGSACSSNDEGVGSSASMANGSVALGSQSASAESASRKYFSGRDTGDDESVKDDHRASYANQSGSDDQNSRNGGGSSSASGDGDDMAVGASACGSSGSRMQNSASRSAANSTPSPDNQEAMSSPTDLTDSSSPTSQSGASHHHSSNLRDMLLSSSTEQLSSSSGRAKSNCSSNSNSSRCNDDSMGMYKFKTNIHQRFTADMVHVYPNLPAQQQPVVSCSEAHDSFRMQSQGQVAKRRKISQDNRHHVVYSPSSSSWNSNECYTSSDSDAQRPRERRSVSPGHNVTPPPSNTFAWPKEKPMELITTKLESEFPKHLETVIVGEPKCEFQHQQHFTQFNAKLKAQHLQQQRMECASPASPGAAATGTENNVPIFALHPKGSFYVPMSVQLSLIESLFTSESTKVQSVLHPVTISVNFCHPLRVLTAKQVDSTNSNGLLLRPIAMPHPQQPQQPQQPRHPHEVLPNGLDRRRTISEHPSAFHQQPPMALLSPSVLTPPDADHRSKRHPYDLEAEARAHLDQVARIRNYQPRHQELPSPRAMRQSDHGEQGPILFRMPQESYEAHGPLTPTADGRRLPRELTEAAPPRPAIVNCSNGLVSSRSRDSSMGNSSRWSHLMAANKRTHTP